MSYVAPKYPIPAEEVCVNLGDFFRHKGDQSLILVLDNSKPEIVYDTSDGWNGRTDYHTLKLLIPMGLFARLEADREKLEKTISTSLKALLPDTEGHVLGAVSIKPKLRENPVRIVEVEVNRLWEAGFIRAFLSHLTENKREVGQLKAALAWYGISGFVAHEDIEPTSEWRIEIENALWSMDTMIALVVPEFHKSKWTDQEVGVAMGRGIPIIPVKWGIDPHGFISKYQALSIGPDRPELIASGVVDILLHKEALVEKMKEAMVTTLERTEEDVALLAVSRKIPLVAKYTQTQLQRIWQATEGKEHLAEVTSAIGHLREFVRASGYAPTAESDDVPF